MDMFRNFPSVAELLEKPELKRIVDRMNAQVVVTNVRTFLDEVRREVKNAAGDVKVPSVSELADRLAFWIMRQQRRGVHPVINATGDLLHDYLGRAPLADEAVDAVLSSAHDYTSAQMNLSTGQPQDSAVGVVGMLKDLSGAEAALVVNNHAGGSLLALTTLASGDRVVISRGELVDFDGTYRITEFIEASGAVLTEVGATNRTTLADYESALNQGAKVVLRISLPGTSAASRPALSELVELAHRHEAVVIESFGAAGLVDFSVSGMTSAPSAAASLQAGADLVLLGGDKLIGGPPCGIVLGKEELVARLQKAPLARALRLDKLRLAALDATLQIHRDTSTLASKLPLWRLAATNVDNLRNRAERIAPQLATSSLVKSAAAISTPGQWGDAFPGEQPQSWSIALEPATGNAEQLAAVLRKATPAVIGRVEQERVLLDMRTVFPRQDQLLVDAILALGQPTPGSTETESTTESDPAPAPE